MLRATCDVFYTRTTPSFTNTLRYLRATLYFSFFFFPEIKSPRVLTSQNLLISSRGVSIGYNRQKTLALRQLQRSHAPQKYRASLGWG